MIGSASGSCFWMTGGSTSGGTFRIAPATFSRTLLAASSRSRSSRNRTVMLAVAAGVDVGRIWSMPAMPLSAFSIGMITAEVISSGAAPGSRSETLTRGRIGLRETDRRRDRGTRRCPAPRATSRASSRRPAAGRRVQTASATPSSPLTVTFMPSARLSTSVSATASPSFTPPRISIRSPTRSPVFSSWAARRSPLTVNTR